MAISAIKMEHIFIATAFSRDKRYKDFWLFGSKIQITLYLNHFYKIVFLICLPSNFFSISKPYHWKEKSFKQNEHVFQDLLYFCMFVSMILWMHSVLLGLTQVYVFCLCNSFEYHKITEKAHFDAPYYSSPDFTSAFFLKYMLHIQKQGFVPFLL